MQHRHRAITTQVSNHSWGARTTQTCACGASRIFDVPSEEVQVVATDYAWSAWSSFDAVPELVSDDPCGPASGLTPLPG